jgi:hypothetical protein
MTRLKDAEDSKDRVAYIFVEAFPRKNVSTLGTSGKMLRIV